jgi:hypothetical protein
MNLIITGASQFPNFVKYVTYELSHVYSVPAIARAWEACTGMTETELLLFLRSGASPDVYIFSDPYGEYTFEANNALTVGKNIRFPAHYAAAFEDGTDVRLARAGKVHFAGVQLLAYLVSWAIRHQDGDVISDTIGWKEARKFKRMVYGEIKSLA